MERVTTEGQLSGMPDPYRYWRTVQDSEVLVGFGPRVMFCFDERDQGMRNLAVVALTQAGVAGKEVAELFGLSAVYVSRLRSRAAEGGSQALLPPRGAPRKLSEARERRAAELSAAGVSGAEIARRMGVSEATVSRLLARRQAPVALQSELELETGEVSACGERPEDRRLAEQASASAEQPVGVEPTGEESTAAILAEQPPPACAGERSAAAGRPADEGQIARLGEVEVGSRYAGAMLLYPFVDRLGAEQVLGSLAAGEARRYDAQALILSACFSFALGGSSLEQAKHLALRDAGALVGLVAFPSLRTLRPRLAALAEACDPLELQRSFATAMLNADERPPELFYVDDHFVTYWGAQPVAKGYNIRRHLAEPGRDDTFVVDDRWRAVCFSSGEPRGLSVSLPDVLWQLQEITGGRPVMIGFDRGGSYPKPSDRTGGDGVDHLAARAACATDHPAAALVGQGQRQTAHLPARRRADRARGLRARPDPPTISV
jgi:transposase